MKKLMNYIIPGLLLMAVVIMSLMKSPEKIAEMLSNISSELTVFSVFIVSTPKVGTVTKFAETSKLN